MKLWTGQSKVPPEERNGVNGEFGICQFIKNWNHILQDFCRFCFLEFNIDIRLTNLSVKLFHNILDPKSAMQLKNNVLLKRTR